MTAATVERRKPPIAVTRSEHENLYRLAEAWSERNPAVVDRLISELDRARVVPDSRLPAQVIRMGSRLRYVTDSGESREVSLVYPGQADISEGKVSILTPIGIALLGLSPGQSIDWQGIDQRVHRLTVESIETVQHAREDVAAS
jgi:regulator of nucleoside diphosphate kinase